MRKRHVRHIGLLLTTALVIALGGCDTVRPNQDQTLVIETWLETDQPLPPIRLSAPLNVAAPLQPLPAQGVVRVEVELEGRVHAYLPVLDNPMRYEPVETETIRPGAGEAFEVRVTQDSRTVRAHGILPPVLHLIGATVTIPDHPVPVVLLDSLQLGLDSLALDIPATTGFIYPVQVEVQWQEDDFSGWIEARLLPSATFSSSLLDFFLLPSEVFEEATASSPVAGVRSWQGVYAIPVTTGTSPLPEHDLNIILLRSNDQYARFATSRNSPQRREPVSNVIGGLGIAAGISLDSLRLHIRP